MPIPETVPILGIKWDDILFGFFGLVMIVSGLLVVTMRDIIRCGLAMIVCFGALAGIYVIIGAPLVAAAQVIVYIGAISVLILFAIMLTENKAAPAGRSILVILTRFAGRAACCERLFVCFARDDLTRTIRHATLLFSADLYTTFGIDPATGAD